jgi:hypothetical protein
MSGKNSNHESTSLWRYIVDATAIGSLVCTIIFGWISYKATRDAIQDARRIAIESVSLDKPELQLLLGSNELQPTLTNRVFLGGPLMEDNAINFGQFPFTLNNRGKKTAKSVGIVDRFPKFARSQLHDILEFESSSILPSKDEVQHDIKEIGNFSYFSYNIPNINPDIKVKFSEPFILKETEFEDEVAAGNGMKLKYFVRFSLQELITTSAEDQEKRDYELTIAVTQAQGEQELVNKVVQILNEELRKQRESLSFPASYLVPLEAKAYVAFAEPKLITEHEGRKFFMLDFPDVNPLTVYSKPYTILLWIYGIALLIGIIFSVFLIRYLSRRILAKKSRT